MKSIAHLLFQFYFNESVARVPFRHLRDNFGDLGVKKFLLLTDGEIRTLIFIILVPRLPRTPWVLYSEKTA